MPYNQHFEFAPPRIVSHFSCGAASAVATKLVCESYEPERVVILNAFLAGEHADNRRFLNDCSIWFDHPIIVVQDEEYGADPYEVFRRHRFTKSRNGAKCSKILKGNILDQHSFYDDVHVLGYTIEEEDRANLYADANNGRKFLTPLIDQELTKADCLAMISRVPIELPMMYRLGYNNANCIGCVKGGMGYWNKIRVDFPAKFEEMARIEDLIGPSAFLFRDRKTGVRYSLRELDPNAGDHNEPAISCSAACEMVEDLIQIAGDGGHDIAGHVRVGRR